MLAGIVFQVGKSRQIHLTPDIDTNYHKPAVVMSAFIVFSTEFMWRYFTDAPVSSRGKSSSQVTLSAGRGRKGDYTGAMRFMVYALAFDSVLLYIRYVAGSFSADRRVH